MRPIRLLLSASTLSGVNLAYSRFFLTANSAKEAHATPTPDKQTTRPTPTDSYDISLEIEPIDDTRAVETAAVTRANECDANPGDAIPTVIATDQIVECTVNPTAIERPVQMVSEAPPETTIGELLRDDDVVAPPRKRLRKRQPPLPQAPDKHPVYKWKNHYDANQKWDPDEKFNFIGIVGCIGNPPHRAYLVHWSSKPVVLSYVWVDCLLPEFADLVHEVDQWFESGSALSFERYAAKHFRRRAGASDDGTCFIQAMQSISWELGHRELITFDHYVSFMKENNLKMEEGVSKSEIMLFFEFLRRKRVRLDYSKMFAKQQKGALCSAAQLEVFGSSLDTGFYLVMASCFRRIRHCFAMIVSDAGKVEVIDGFSADNSPAYIKESVLALAWIVEVNLIRHVCLA